MKCPDYGKNNVSTFMFNQSFNYGTDDIKLKATIPIRHCNDCGFEFTDSETELIKDKVVQNYLER